MGSFLLPRVADKRRLLLQLSNNRLGRFQLVFEGVMQLNAIQCIYKTRSRFKIYVAGRDKTKYIKKIVEFKKFSLIKRCILCKTSIGYDAHLSVWRINILDFSCYKIYSNRKQLLKFSEIDLCFISPKMWGLYSPLYSKDGI